MSFFSSITHFVGNTLGATIGAAVGGPLGGFIGRITGGFLGDLVDKISSFVMKQVEQIAAKFLPAGDARDIFEKAYESAYSAVFE